MLSNKDFSKLLSTPSASGGEGKVRFDLKQISQWDKEIKSKYKHKETNNSAISKPKDSKNESDEAGGPMYRDRAEERRKDANPDYDLESIQALLRLDAEKTKFLGGDVDHTYLVKGLDYTLLRKMKTEVETQIKSSSLESKEGVSSLNEITPITELGLKIKSVLLQNEALRPSPKALSDSYFSRMAFEFDLDPSSEQELPTTIARSKLESSVSEGHLTFLPPPELLIKLGETMTNSKHSKHRRKKQTEEARPAEGEKGRAALKVVDTVGDIFDDVGKYVPVGSLSDDTKDTELVGAATVPNKLVQGVDRKAYFSWGDRSGGAAGVAGGGNDEEGAEASRDEIMAPVKAILRAQSEKEKALQAEKGRRERPAPMWDEEAVGAGGRVHRDVIGALGAGEAERRGDAMGVGDSYDLYPESEAADYQFGGSDEDDEPKAGAKKEKKDQRPNKPPAGPKPAGPKASSGSSGQGGGGGSAAAVGLNRAARRAMAKGDRDDGPSSKKAKHA